MHEVTWLANYNVQFFLSGWGERGGACPWLSPLGLALHCLLCIDGHLWNMILTSYNWECKDCACNFKLGAREGGQGDRNLTFLDSFKQIYHVSDHIFSSALCFVPWERPFHQLCHYCVPPDVLWSAFLVLPLWVPLYGPLGYVSIWSESSACGQSPPNSLSHLLLYWSLPHF